MTRKRALQHICSVAVGLATVILLSGDARAQKVGPWMFNLKLGPAIEVNDAVNQFALELEAGYAVTGDRNGYIIFPFTMQFSENVTVIGVPFGFQYDIPIAALKGLYISPRFAIGYAAVIASGGRGGDSNTESLFLLQPEVQIKYVYNGRFNFMFEPFSMPIGVNGDFTFVQYRLMFGAGINL